MTLLKSGHKFSLPKSWQRCTKEVYQMSMIQIAQVLSPLLVSLTKEVAVVASTTSPMRKRWFQTTSSKLQRQ